MGTDRYQSANRLDAKEQAIVDLVRLGLSGDAMSVRQLGRKLLRRKVAGEGTPAFREALGGVLVGADGGSPLRAARPPMPVEPESQLPLAALEYDPAGERPVLRPVEASLMDGLIEQRRQAARLADVGLEPPKTVLLSGPPGVGKTMTARYLAGQLGLPLITVELAALMSSLLGKTGQNLRHLLDNARAAPCVLLLDEFDAVAKRRDDQSDIGELKRLVNVLLLELERWPSAGLLIAATNHAHLLDPAVGRRFDVDITLSLPDQTERVAILESAVERVGLTVPRDVLAACALALQGDSGAELERTVAQAARQAVLADTALERVFAELALAPLRAGASASGEQRAAFCGLAIDQLGLSHRTVARMLGISHPTVGKLARRWREQTDIDPRGVAVGA